MPVRLLRQLRAFEQSARMMVQEFANDVHSLGEALHFEFKPLAVCVTVLAAGFTDTAVIGKFGLDPKTMPMKPMSVDQCVSEALGGLGAKTAPESFQAG